MSDLIDRDETIKQFCKQDCGCDPKDCLDKTCYEVEIIESVPTHPTPSNTLGALDCVSREDLTKEIETYFGDLPIAVHYDMLALAQKLPSVQPEIIRCKDCVHNDGGNPISDGRYWCMIHNSYMYYCSDGELRGDSDD